MTLTQLQAFVQAAALGTFTAAAVELQMSQPAVSDLIRRLEHELGAPLFHRGPRLLVLSAAGEQLLPHAQLAVTSAHRGTMAVRSQQSLGGGTATFGLLRNADHYLNTDLAARFRSAYPRVRIRLVGQNSAETAAAVSTGALEAAMVTLPIDDDGLDVVPLARDEVVYLTADPTRASSARSIHDVCAAPLVLYDAHFAGTDPARRQLDTRAQMAGARVEPEIEVEYMSTAVSLVRAGYGDTIICRAAATAATIDGLFTATFTDPMYDTLALVKRTGSVLSPATREVARMAVESLIDHQSRDAGTADITVDPDRLSAFLGAPAPTPAAA